MFGAVSAAVALCGTAVYAQTGTFPAGVVGTGTMGVTNPTAAVMNTPLNQSSDARLLTLNSVDDFCLYAPPTLNSIAETETEEVAWCTKPRNNARLIPDGVIKSVSFLKTDFYVQIMGTGDFTQINIQAGDEGGELDPHGAEGTGNPIGGNVTTNITGSELNVAEWMQYISASEFCIRACTNANATYSAAQMCWHELDEVGCRFVMPGNYNFQGFQSCEADVAYPPGWYPTSTYSNGTTAFSTFAQYFTGIYTRNGTPVAYTVGTTVTPTTAAFTPSSSNCQTVSAIGNGILSVSGSSTVTIGSVSGSPTNDVGSSSSSKSAGQTTGTTSAGGSSGGKNAARGVFPKMGALLGLTAASVITVATGVLMVL